MADKKTILYLKPSQRYQPGDIRTCKAGEADKEVLRGVAKPHVVGLSGEELEELAPVDLPPSSRDKAEAKAAKEEEEAAYLPVDRLNPTIEAYLDEDSLEGLKNLGKEYGVKSWHVRGAESLLEALLEHVNPEEIEDVLELE